MNSPLARFAHLWREGIGSVQLHAQIGVTQKTAWSMLKRLREACGNDPTKLAGIVPFLPVR